MYPPCARVHDLLAVALLALQFNEDKVRANDGFLSPNSRECCTLEILEENETLDADEARITKSVT